MKCGAFENVLKREWFNRLFITELFSLRKGLGNDVDLCTERAKAISFGQGNIFTSVCHSFCSRGGSGLVPGGGLVRGVPPNFQGGLQIFGGFLQIFGGSPNFRGSPIFRGYASYWNAFLFSLMFAIYSLSFFTFTFTLKLVTWSFQRHFARFDA